MPATTNIALSNSHKETVKWELKIDKLTLLLALPESWKQGLVSRYIELVTNTSNQSQYGITRSYSKGSRGYEISLEGKVPLSTSPLIWSPDAGYYLQAGPKAPKTSKGADKAWIRLDINPRCLTPEGLSYLCILLKDIFEIPWSVWGFARVSRIDVAVDLHGVALTEWVWDVPKRTSRELICRNREPETIYIGAKKANPVVAYNKAEQDPTAPGDGALTRVEYRGKNPGLVSGLLEIPNPFIDLLICNSRKLSYPEPHRVALMAVGHLQGVHGILRTFPEVVRPAIRQHLLASRATWWDPSAIWQAWTQCCKTTVPCSSTSSGELHDEALAYLQSMEAETQPKAPTSVENL